MPTSSPTLWMVQGNLGNKEVNEQIEQICQNHNLPFAGVKLIPFSDDLPDIYHNGPVMAYGSTRFVKKIYDSKRWKPGAFFDERLFNCDVYNNHYGWHMLNFGAAILPLWMVKGLTTLYKSKDLLFVRPNGDMKEFPGEVMEFQELCDFAETVISGKCDFSQRILVSVARCQNIMTEWRLFAVNLDEPCIIAATRYKQSGHLNPKYDAPQKVLEFAKARLDEWMPTDACAIDIAETYSGELKIVELSGINSAGFYAAGVENIITFASTAAQKYYDRN